MKDIGLVGQDGSLAGRGGRGCRHVGAQSGPADHRRDDRRALEAAVLFFQYYRGHGNYLERTYDFVERLGIDKVRKDTVYAPEPVRQGLLDRLARSKALSRDAWLEGQAPVHPTQFTPIQAIDRANP